MTGKTLDIIGRLLREFPQASPLIADLLESLKDAASPQEQEILAVEASGYQQNAEATAQSFAAMSAVNQARLVQAVNLGATAEPKSPKKKPNKARYELQNLGSGEYELVEYYGINRIRCPKSLYDKVAKAFDTDGEPVDFGDLVKYLNRKRGQNDMHIRTLIRFWKRHDMIGATFTPYVPVASFAEKAAALWEQMRFGPDEAATGNKAKNEIAE